MPYLGIAGVGFVFVTLSFAFGFVVGGSAWRHLAKESYAALQSLRANCFLTNDRGHRVRWANATPEVRAKAERAR